MSGGGVSPLAVARSGTAVVVRVRGEAASVLIRPRGWLVGLALLGVVAALCVLAVAIGTRLVPFDEVLQGLVGRADRATTLTVQRFRLPRVVVGVLVGAALGLSGAIVQALTRNPIAAPDVIGVSAGASCGAVLVLLAAGGTTVGSGGAAAGLSRIGLPAGAVLGALVAAVIVLGTAGARNRAGSGFTFSTQRVVLVGVICHAALIGLVHWALAAGDVDQASKAAAWLMGSLHGRGWEHATGIGLALAFLLPVALVLGRRLHVLALGEDAAATQGVAVTRTQLGLFGLAFALTGAAVAAAGPVNFVALLAPQIARRLAGTPGTPLVSSALTGAALLLAADLVARLLVPGTELPAGAVTALVGAPCLLWLVRRVPGGGRR